MSVALRERTPGPCADPGTAGPGQFLSFRLDGHSYAVPLSLVAEITPSRDLNHIPHMPPGVEGLLDHRGQVIPVINLRSRMHLHAQDAALSRNIVVLDLGGTHPVGILVDAVASVITASPGQLVPASPLLTGPEGAWVLGFILVQAEIISLLDPGLITATRAAQTVGQSAAVQDQDRALDQGLRELIAMAPPRTGADRTRIIPQMEEAIRHTEEEMAKVLDCAEAMLTDSDLAIQAMVRLKQESALGRFKGAEPAVAELEKLGTEMQDQVFTLIQQLQFQDIARQKLERVLNHIRGIQVTVGAKFRDQGKK